jgi:hypothetical protein
MRVCAFKSLCFCRFTHDTIYLCEIADKQTDMQAEVQVSMQN